MTTPLDRMADFDLTPEQREVRRVVREFAEKEILPHVERYEGEERYPLELIAKLPAMGLMGPMIPRRIRWLIFRHRHLRGHLRRNCSRRLGRRVRDFGEQFTVRGIDPPLWD